MATARKDFRGRVLRKGEVQRASDKRYMYCYTDPFGRRKYIYANDLVTLREKEMRLTKNQLDGLDTYVAGYATVNFVFDRYISLKTNLRETTRSNYLYRLSKNSCRGEHCSPVPVYLVRKPSRKARCCAKLAGDQWSPLHSLYSKVDVF